LKFTKIAHPKQYPNGHPSEQEKQNKKKKIEGNDDLPEFKTPFCETDYGDGDFNPIPVLKIHQSSLTCEIVSKPKWYEKLKNETIVNKWKQESESKFTKEMFQYSMDELNFHVKKSQDYESILVSPIYAVYQSDELISLELSKEFKKNALKLENVPENELDWHPGSKNQVIRYITELGS
jgi:hypothetical protein